MKTCILIILILLGQAIAQENLPAEFKKLLKNGKLIFSLPEKFKLKTNCADSLVFSDICFKHTSHDIEIRIDIELSDSTDKNQPILRFYKKGSYESLELDPKNFNATKAGSASFKIDNEFDIGFKQCWQIWLYKEKTSSVNIFILFGEKNLTEKDILKYIQIMKFNE